jgi:hypothetical protein
MQGTYGQYIGIDRDSKTVLLINSFDNAEVAGLRSLRTYRLFQSVIAATNPQ